MARIGGIDTINIVQSSYVLAKDEFKKNETLLKTTTNMESPEIVASIKISPQKQGFIW